MKSSGNYIVYDHPLFLQSFLSLSLNVYIDVYQVVITRLIYSSHNDIHLWTFLSPWGERLAVKIYGSFEEQYFSFEANVNSLNRKRWLNKLTCPIFRCNFMTQKSFSRKYRNVLQKYDPKFLCSQSSIILYMYKKRQEKDVHFYYMYSVHVPNPCYIKKKETCQMSI